jgi:ABC-2 type transport system ATP-binding protein
MDQRTPHNTISAPAAIETTELTRCFGELRAVDRLCFTVRRGSIFGLLGPNGAGKSTTIKMLTTLLPPTSGSAYVAGFNITTKSRDVRRCLGYVPQVVSAEAGLSGFENLLIFAKLYGIPSSVRRQRIEETLELLDLQDAQGALVRTYSGGMVRRLEIALALLHQPAVLFLDEPTVGLDPLARHSVWEYLQGIRAEGDKTIVITTHHMQEAEELCDQLAIMNQGVVQTVGSPASLKAEVGHAATLHDVFAHFASASIQTGGFQDAVRTRRTASRLG